MSTKLDNATWEEYINKFEACKGEVTVKDFCIENKLSKSQFYYHKRRLEKESFTTVFHAISLTKQDNVEENIAGSKEVKITVDQLTRVKYKFKKISYLKNGIGNKPLFKYEQ